MHVDLLNLCIILVGISERRGQLARRLGVDGRAKLK
jgi:hypothetical protein